VASKLVDLLSALASPDKQAARPEDLEAQALKADQDWLASLGPDPFQRAKAIEAMFEQRSGTIVTTLFDKWTAKPTAAGGADVTLWINLTVSRQLAAMDPRERNALRCAEHLNSLFGGQFALYRRWCAALIWGDRKGSSTGPVQFQGWNTADPIGDYSRMLGLSAAQVMNAISGHIREIKDDPQAPQPLRGVCQGLFDAFGENLAGVASSAAAAAPIAEVRPAAPAPPPPPPSPRAPAAPSPVNQPAAGGFPLGGDTEPPNFLKPSEAPQTKTYKAQTPYALHIGTFRNGTWLSYSGPGALVSIAGPGSGKSQCHVIPNLLQWSAPAVVLDVTGALYAKTSTWRAANVGPVFRFAPTDPARSHHYNPLAFVSDEVDQIWQESRFLAEMLIVPSAANAKADPFFDESAKALVTAAVAYVCYSPAPQQRTMSKLLDIVSGGSALEDMINGLGAAVDVPPMVRAGTKLREMDTKTRANILATVQTSFRAWEDVPVARITDRCDWSPLDLRNGSPGSHPTIYICLKPREVEAYISILRVFIAQHIRMLTGGDASESDRAKHLPVLFMLDELPRLKHMPPVAEAIEIGGNYGLRIWMFAQSMGQLQEAYPNAEGMIGNCAVRVYMNPSGADEMAEKLSKELGEVQGMGDPHPRRLVPAVELAGPKWANDQLVLAPMTKPARVRRNYAFESPELQARMGSA
jgi:type IV secretion system protein VirD4